MWNNRKFRLRKITYMTYVYDDGGAVDCLDFDEMIVPVSWMKYPSITEYVRPTSWIPEWVLKDFPEDEQPLTDRQLFSELRPYYLPPELREKEDYELPFETDDDLPFN
jgi:hypothetical protein